MSGIEVEFHGDRPNDARAVGRTLVALDALFREVSREVTGHEIGLAVTGFAWRCDGCGQGAEAIPEDWVKVGADDFCPNCSPPAAQEGER